MQQDSTRFDESGRNGRETVVTRRAALRSGAAGLAATTGLAAFSTSVAAEQGAIWDFADDDGDRGSLGETFTRLRASVGGAWDRMTADPEARTAAESARATTQVFNTHSGVLVDYANARLASGREKADYDTIRIVFEKDETVRRWITATVDDSNAYTQAAMTSTRPDRDVDHWVRLEGLAATEAPDELERFVDEYAEPNKPIDARLEGRFAGKYGPDVTSSLL